MGGDVFYVGKILEPPLDLERTDAGIDQRGEVGALVVVLERQQVFVPGQNLPVLLGQRPGQAAGL